MAERKTEEKTELTVEEIANSLFEIHYGKGSRKVDLRLPCWRAENGLRRRSSSNRGSINLGQGNGTDKGDSL